MAKPPEKSPEEKRREEIMEILAESGPGFSDFKESKESEEDVFETESKSYKRFKEEEKIFKKETIYEKLCKISEKINIEPDENTREKMQNAIEFAHLNITPTGAFSFAVAVGIVMMVISLLSPVFGAGLTVAIFMLGVSMVILVFLVKYPEFLADNFRIKASQEIILAIIYIVIYMRTSPQMEGAILFAAKNLSGPLAYDLRKILWDVETRKYETIYDAMTDYLKSWGKNREFMEAIQLIKTSMEQPESKRHEMLDEAINIILEGTEDKMRRYSQSLRTPVTIIYALGITLPVLVLVLFPIIILMLNESIKPIFLVIGYDIVLPLVIYVVSYNILSRRPLGYSTPDTTLHPGHAPVGKMAVKFFGRDFFAPLWPFGLALASPFMIFGAVMMLSDTSSVGFVSLSGSLIIIMGIAIGMSVMFLIDTRKKIGIRNKIKKMQDEFGEALFQLGNRLALGNPIEKAMKQTMEKSSNLTISKLFGATLDNIKRGNMSLEEALFDKKNGAIWKYPSKLIINVMRIIFEATRKGVKNAALSSISISRYVKQMHHIEESLNEMLSESTSSMRVLGMFIAPLIAGVTVTMTAVMMMIFDTLGGLLEGVEMSSSSTGGMGLDSMMMGGWGEIGEILSIGNFQLVVGIYMIEICYLLAYLVSGIDNGEGDLVARRELAGYNILIGITVYTLTVLATYFIFSPMVGTLISAA